MHCRSCEILLEKNISKVAGVKKVRVNHKKGVAEIEHEAPLQGADIDRAVQDAGYQLGKEDKKSFFSKNLGDYFEVAAVASILLVIYLLADSFGLLDLSFNTGSNPSYFAVVLIGLTAGISTCMALIGGLVLGISSRHAELHPESSASEKFRPHLFFNLGRIISYMILGGLIGLLGSAFQLSTSMLGILTLILGAIMLFLGLKLIDIFPRLSNKSLTLPKGISRMLGLGGDMKEYSHRGSFVTGALTFFVPCGFTQAMQLYAVSTGSFTQGMLIMSLFAFGTMPGLLGIGGLTSVVKGAFSRYFFKFAGVLVIAFAVFNISNGYNLTGFTFASVTIYNSTVSGTGGSKSGTEPAGAKIENGVQVIQMEQLGNGYRPNQFTIKKDIPVRWVINSTNSYTCAAYVVIPSINISKALQRGKNVVEFTPTKSGPMRFMCGMGMYTGTFNVVD